MSASRTVVPQIPPASPIRTREVPFSARRMVLDLLLTAQSQLDRFAGTALAALLVFLTLWTLRSSAGKLLWFDELLGLIVASQKSASTVVAALKARLDYSAPLYHVVDHFFVVALGPSATSARIPAFLGICTLCVCLYLFVSRRLSGIYGLLAVVLVLCTPAAFYAWEGRPYGLVMGFAGIALLMYQNITGNRRTLFSFLAYALACAGMVATHYFAILVIGAFLAGELVRYWQSRKIDWAAVLASVLPPLAVLAALSRVILAQRVHRPATSLLAFSGGYDRLRFGAWSIAFAIGLLALGVWLQGAEPRPAQTIPRKNFALHEIVVCWALLLLPLIGAVLGRYVTHAYIARYFMAEVIGISVLICILVSSFSERCAVAALLTLVAGTALILKEGVPAIMSPAPGKPMVSLWKDATTPILFETANDFLQASYYYPQRRSQFWYVAEPEIARKMGRDDLEDINLRALAAWTPMQITSLDKFVRDTPSFVLIPKESNQHVGWVAECLFSSGADMKLATMSEGYVARSEGTILWQPDYLFKVTVPPSASQLVNGCHAGGAKLSSGF